MPEMRFEIEWPDGERQTCYSPSLVVKEHLEPGRAYDVGDFLARCRAALQIASDRVRAKYGFPCGLASAELERLSRVAAAYEGRPGAKVRVLGFVE
jgi:uncharacterized repeat protein (TIGR04042 family)